MTAAALIDTLRAAGFTLATDSARLTVRPAAKLTDAMFEAARARLKSKLGHLNAGIDPEMLADGAVMAAYYIERGFRSFAAYSAQMVESMGESIRPYLRAFYEGARHFPGFDAEGMTSYADLEQMKDAEPAPAEAGTPAETESATHTGNDEAPREDAQDDSTTQRREDAVDQDLDEGPQPNDAVRGTQQPRDGDGFEDDRVIRDGGEQGNGRDDAQRNVGDRGRDERVRGGKNGAVENRRKRVSGADYRPGIGGLTREGSWFDATLAAASGAEPTTHCPTCGSPSWWLSPEGWCCAYCDPRPAAFTGASLVIADTWADGRAPALDEEPGHPAEPEPVRPDDGRVKDLAGAWRSPEHHAACAAFYAHHAACSACRRAGQRRGLARCDVGRALHSAYTLAALSDRGGRP